MKSLCWVCIYSNFSGFDLLLLSDYLPLFINFLVSYSLYGGMTTFVNLFCASSLTNFISLIWLVFLSLSFIKIENFSINCWFLNFADSCHPPSLDMEASHWSLDLEAPHWSLDWCTSGTRPVFPSFSFSLRLTSHSTTPKF